MSPIHCEWKGGHDEACGAVPGPGYCHVGARGGVWQGWPGAGAQIRREGKHLTRQAPSPPVPGHTCHTGVGGFKRPPRSLQLSPRPSQGPCSCWAPWP